MTTDEELELFVTKEILPQKDGASPAKFEPCEADVLDELDENGKCLGRTISRAEAHRTGAWHRAVLLFLVNSKNQILMQKRSAHKKLWPNCWDGTGGGHVDAGEIGLFSVIRELKEELGIDVRPDEVRYIGGYRSDRVMGDIHNRHFNEFYVAHRDFNVADVKIDKTEVDEVKWIDFDEFKRWTKSRSSELTSKWEAFDSLVRYMERYVI